MEKTDLQFISNIIKARPRDIHKGQCGRVMVAAGSKGMAGAAVLATSAALKSGAGLVTCATSLELFNILQISVPQAMCTCIDEPDFIEKALRSNAVALGPGMGISADKYNIIKELLINFTGTIVIDADGITNLCKYTEGSDLLLGHQKVVLTPHEGECERILTALGEKSLREIGRVKAAEVISEKTGACLLLKGPDTLVAHKARIYVNTTGNPGMATGGSGDVLSGVIAALAGSGIELCDAVRAGAFIHGMAGDIAAERFGQWGMTSVDIRDMLPEAFKRIVGM